MPSPATTRWTLVRRAAESTPQGRRALAELLEIYAPPLRAQLARWHVAGADHDDLWQEFVARLMEGEWLRRADAGSGSFRAFLGTALQRYASNRVREVTAGKRGGSGSTYVQHEELEALATEDAGPDDQFHREWAQLVLQRATAALRREVRARGKDALFQALEPFLAEDAQREDYVTLGARLGSTPNAVAVAVHRLRARLRELLRREVLQTVDEAALAGELEALRDALRQ